VTTELHGAEAVDLIQIQTRAIDAIEPLVNQQRVKLELEKKHELVDHLVVYPPKDSVCMHVWMKNGRVHQHVCLNFVVVFLFIDGVHRVLRLGITVRVMDRGVVTHRFSGLAREFSGDRVAHVIPFVPTEVEACRECNGADENAAPRHPQLGVLGSRSSTSEGCGSATTTTAVVIAVVVVVVVAVVAAAVLVVAVAAAAGTPCTCRPRGLIAVMRSNNVGISV